MNELEEKFVLHAAATLKGVKAASLFTHNLQEGKLSELRSYQDKVQAFHKTIAILRQALSEKGLAIRILTRCTRTRQIFVYRPRLLAKLLCEAEVQAYLMEQNYEPIKERPNSEQVERLLDDLCDRFTHSDVFPHELGLFLGYPVADVRGFIEQEGKNYLFSGLWKVYGCPEHALKLFAKYQGCCALCAQEWAKGMSIEEMSVAV